MVFKKLLASLGFGGVEVDTVLSPPVSRPGGPLAGHVHLKAKGDVDITGIGLLIVAGGGHGQAELARIPVAGRMTLQGGTTTALPFTVTTPYLAPMTLIYGKHMPGIQVGVRTEVAVEAGTGKTDFDQFGVEPTIVHQGVLDALGAIGCRFVRNELRPGGLTGLPVAAAQAITFYAPIPEGQPPGPHIPQLVFTFAADPGGVTVLAEVASRPGTGEQHRVDYARAEQLLAQPEAWVLEVDGWVRSVLDRLGQLPAQNPGSFMQPNQYGQQGYGQPAYAPGRGQQYAYPGAGQRGGGYKYGGYRPGMGSMIGAGLGGAALGLFGGMIIGDMISDAFTPDAPQGLDGSGADTGGDAGVDGTQADYADSGSGYDGGGPDAGGYDSGGYDGGGFDGGGDFGGGDF